MRSLIAALLVPLLGLPAQQPGPLQLEQFVADSTAFHVNAVLILGATEAILVDGQYYLPDAQRVADRIAASGRRLKAIVLTHPDHDHFAGAAAIVERFPGTPMYMTRAGLESYRATAQRDFLQDRSRRPATFADSIVMPQELPSNQLTVDGQAVEIIPDLQGDVHAAVNSIVWIPSLRAVIASDVVFNQVHPWLAVSTPETRQAWRQSLERIRSLRPRTVIAGHKPSATASDNPAVIDAMERYLTDFEATRLASADVAAMVATLRTKYPDWKVTMLLRASANRTFNQGRSAGGAP